MSVKKIRSAAATLAQSIQECMNGIRPNLPSGASIYSVALVVSDDFDSLMVFANTDLHFAESKGGMLDKWYFAQWWSEGMDIDTDPLVEKLGEVEDSDEDPASGNAVDWLGAMTDALRTAKGLGAFKSNGKDPFLFCTMSDSLNAIWLEDLSAQFLNSADSYAAVAPELSTAAKEWYVDDDDEDDDGGEDDEDDDDNNEEESRIAFKVAYEKLLPKLGPAM